MSFKQKSDPENFESQFSTLFADYRNAVPDLEPSVNFMPELWARIDARRSFSFSLRRLAQGIITAAAAITLVMGVYLTRVDQSVFYNNTYLELLAADQSHENLADAEIVQALHERD